MLTLLGNFLKDVTLIVFIISLLRYTKQSAKTFHLIMKRVHTVQVLHCLAPAFFRMGILNCFSATFISSL